MEYEKIVTHKEGRKEMKTWKTPSVEELNISETANGWHSLWTEGEARPWPFGGNHKTGSNPTSDTPAAPTPAAPTPVDPNEGRSTGTEDIANDFSA